MSKANIEKKYKRDGVKCMPVWLRLVYFNWAEDVCLDYMHMLKNCGHRNRNVLGTEYREDQDDAAFHEIAKAEAEARRAPRARFGPEPPPPMPPHVKVRLIVSLISCIKRAQIARFPSRFTYETQ